MRKSSRSKVVLAIVAALALSTLAPAAAVREIRPAKPVSGIMRSWRLAFVRDGDIWVANGDGSGQRMIIKDGLSPAWSPDKTRIAFVRKGNVWVANGDGGGQRQLTFKWTSADVKGLGHDFAETSTVDVSWDPRADMITFSHWEDFRLARGEDGETRTIACCSIYDVPTMASKHHPKLIRRFDVTDHEAAYLFSYHSHPAWSRSGRMLAFVRNGDIWIAERYLDRKGEPTFRLGDSYRAGIWEITATRLAAVAKYDAPTDRASRENEGVVHLSWSPDEKHLAYEIRRVSGSGFDEIHVLELRRDHYQRPVPAVDRRLVESGSDPCFSQDGRYIACELWGDGSQGVWAVSVDGMTRQQLVKDGEQPAW